MSDGAGAPEAITGDTSPHAGLAFARDGARVVNRVRKREQLIWKELHMSKTVASESRSRLQRTKSVGFRVRPQEYEELLRSADEAGMPIGEWIRDVSLRAARSDGDNMAKLISLPAMVRINLEELAALRAVVLTLFGTTNPSLGKEEIDQVVAYADSVKRERADTLLRRQA